MPPSSVEVERVRGNLGKLADAYGVSAFVVTSLTADTNRLVLNVQLVEARSRRLMWSRDFEGRRDGYLALARNAAEELRGAVRPQAAAVVAQSTTSNSDAELAYQRGMHHFHRYNYQHERRSSNRVLPRFSRRWRSNRGWRTRPPASPGCTSSRSRQGLRSHGAAEMRVWGQRALEMDNRNSRAWAVRVGHGASGHTEPVPRRADRRRCARPPMDRGTGLRSTRPASRWGALLSSLSLASDAGGGAAGSPLSVCAPECLGTAGVSQSPRGRRWPTRRTCCASEPDMPVAQIRKGLALIELGRSRRPGRP